MNKRKLLKFAKMLNAFAELTTDNGVLISDGDIKVGSEVFVSVGDEMVPATDGEYKTDNEIYIVVGGVVTEVKQIELEPIVEPAEPATMAEPEPVVEPIVEPAEPNEPTEPTEVELLKKALEEANSAIKELVLTMNGITERLVAVEEAIKEPQAEPIDEPKVKDTKLSAIAQAFARK